MPSYHEKDISYFTNARLDILPLLNRPVDKALEIGCGNGATLKYLKEKGYCKYSCGLELMPHVADQTKNDLDEWVFGDVEQLLPSWPANTYDLVLCLDVLEHLVDPWKVVDEIGRILKPGGVLIASIPNLRTATVIANLLFKGSFDYADQGIMDRTHLRYFTQKTALALLNRPPLQVERWMPSPMANGSKSQWVNTLSFGLFRDLLTEQFLIRTVVKK